MSSSNPVVVIPARLAATRLPNKPLADIHGEPMIVHVWRRSVAANLGPVIVACGDRPIADAVEAVGGTAVMTDPDLPSGSDRIAQALRSVDPEGRHDIVVNIQGDLPTLDPALPQAAMALLADKAVDIGTLAAVIVRDEEKTNPAIVKAIVEREEGSRVGRAFYFTRTTAPSGDGPLLHHIGLYAYRRAALERYVTLPPAALERREKLEQLRALIAGMRIDVAIVDTVPLGVDTQDELERARRLLAEGAVR